MILFSSPTCGPCKPVHAFIKNHGIEAEIVDVSTDEGRSKAAHLGVRSTPTLVVGNRIYVTDNSCMKFLREYLWDKGEERMKPVSQNGNTGEHYIDSE